MATMADRKLDVASSELISRVRAPFSERPVGVWTIRIVTLVVVLGTWEIYGRAQNRALFAPVSRVAESFYELAIASNQLWVAMWDSLQALLIGYAAAVVVGIIVGLLMGRYRTVEQLLDPYVSFFYALPMIVMVPLIIMWLGIGAPTRITIVFLLAVWPVIINTMAGGKEVPDDLVDVARMHCATERQMVRTVVVPSIMPYVFTGLYVAVGAAIIGMVLGEMLVVLRGLGGMIVRGSNSYQPDQVFVALFAMVIESLALTAGIAWLRRRLMPWAT